jgi:hypothetical protein
LHIAFPFCLFVNIILIIISFSNSIFYKLIVLYLRLIFLFWSEFIIICLKLRLCCGCVGSNSGFAGSDLAGSDFGCLVFGFFCTACLGDCDLIIKWFGEGSINNGFGGGGIGRFEAGGLGHDGGCGGGIGNEGARGGGIGKNEGGR